MTKIREYSKALAALLGAVATFLVTVNAPAEWSVYLGSVVAILTGVATLGVSNVKIPTAPVDQAITSIQQTVQNATQAAAEVDKLREAATDALSNVPIIGSALGPLATQVINSLPRL